MSDTTIEASPSVGHLLKDHRIFGNVCERKSYLQSVIQAARRSPPGSTFSSLCRQLAKLSFEVEEDDEGIFSLIESHGVVLRHKVIMKYHRTLRKDPQTSNVIKAKYVEFDGEYCDGFNSVLKRLREMPKEWTIVQLSCVVDAVWRLGGPNAETWTPKIHIVRMECGLQPDFRPMHLQLFPPPESANFVVMKQMQEMLWKNRTDHLRENKHAFWEARQQVDETLRNIINYMNSNWFVSMSPFLSGSLADCKLKKKIKESVLKIIKKVSKDSDNSLLPDVNFCLLVKAAENINYLSEKSLLSIICRSFNDHSGSLIVKNILKEFDSLRQEFSHVLTTARKHPVILIIDEKLDCFPFEHLEVLKDHPVTRLPSLHLVHGLYSVHKNTIVNGLKVLDCDSGFYMINPSRDLRAMEERMSTFLLPRVPSWKGVVGDCLSGKEWSEALQESDLFVYMGHGSGSQYWNVEQVATGIRSTVLLFGCKSAGYKSMRGCIEVDSSLRAYLASACPCIIGMLWEVTDKDTDLVAQAMLDECLPKYASSVSEVTNKSKKGKKVSAEEVASHIMPPSEPEVARAINIGRKAARMLLTQAAIIVRGLPVCIK